MLRLLALCLALQATTLLAARFPSPSFSSRLGQAVSAGGGGGGGGNGAVGYDTGAVTNWDSSGAGQPFTIPCGSTGDNRVLAVLYNTYYPGHVLNSITYSGVGLSLVMSTNFYSDGGGTCAIYFLTAPASGTHNLVLTFDRSMDFGGSICAFFLTNANQSASVGVPVGTYDPASGGAVTSISDSPASAVNDLVIDVLGQYDTTHTATPGGGQTQPLPDTKTSQTTGTASYKAGAAGSTTMSWSLSSAENLSHIAVAIKAR